MAMNLDWYKTNGGEFSNTPSYSGVYIISTKQKIDDQFEVKYVGQADNIQERAKQHWSNDEENTELKNHIAKGYIMKFSYAEVSKQLDRDNIELFLYKKFDPIYNKNTPPGSKILECSLPDVRKHN